MDAAVIEACNVAFRSSEFTETGRFPLTKPAVFFDQVEARSTDVEQLMLLSTGDGSAGSNTRGERRPFFMLHNNYWAGEEFRAEYRAPLISGPRAVAANNATDTVPCTDINRISDPDETREMFCIEADPDQSGTNRAFILGDYAEVDPTCYRGNFDSFSGSSGGGILVMDPFNTTETFDAAPEDIPQPLGLRAIHQGIFATNLQSVSWTEPVSVSTSMDSVFEQPLAYAFNLDTNGLPYFHGKELLVDDAMAEYASGDTSLTPIFDTPNGIPTDVGCLLEQNGGCVSRGFGPFPSPTGDAPPSLADTVFQSLPDDLEDMWTRPEQNQTNPDHPEPTSLRTYFTFLCDHQAWGPDPGGYAVGLVGSPAQLDLNEPNVIGRDGTTTPLSVVIEKEVRLAQRNGLVYDEGTFDASQRPVIPVIGGLQMVCAPWGTQPYTDNWRFLYYSGRSARLFLNNVLRFVRGLYRGALRVGLTEVFERRPVQFIDRDGEEVFEEQLRPMSMQLCPPNMALQGITFRLSPPIELDGLSGQSTHHIFEGVSAVTCVRVNEAATRDRLTLNLATPGQTAFFDHTLGGEPFSMTPFIGNPYPGPVDGPDDEKPSRVVADCAEEMEDGLAVIKGFIIESVKGHFGVVTNVFPLCQRNPLSPN